MSSRLVVPLLCTAALVFACGPRPKGTTAPVPAGGRALRLADLDGMHASAQRHVAPRHKRDTTGVGADFEVTPGADGVRLSLQVVNQSARRLEIDFPDGRTRDFVIYDAAGHEVWRWSRGRLFTQTVQNKFLAAGDTAVYEEEWKRAGPGEYTAVAVLHSKNFPVERRVSFQLHSPSIAVASARVP